MAGGEIHTVVAEGTVGRGGWVLVDGTTIAALGPAGSEPAGVSERLDATGCAVVRVVRHTTASSIQTGISCRRALVASTRLQRADAPVALSITS